MNHHSVLNPLRAAALAHLRVRYSPETRTFPTAIIGSAADRLAAIGRTAPPEPEQLAAAIKHHRPPAVLAGNFESFRYVTYESENRTRKFALKVIDVMNTPAIALMLSLGDTMLVYLLNPADPHVVEFMSVAASCGISFIVARPKGVTDKITVRLLPDDVERASDAIFAASARRKNHRKFASNLPDAIASKAVLRATYGAPPCYFKAVVQTCVVATSETGELMRYGAAPTWWNYAGKARLRNRIEKEARARKAVELA